MVGITVIIPTLGERDYARTFSSIHPVHKNDRVIVAHDHERLGAYGHAIRNQVLDENPDREGYCWSIDDDDIAAPHALAIIRIAIAAFPGAWFIFQMQGGANSHWHGLKVPHAGPKILPGNVGTPCIVWPASAESRWGTDQLNQINGPGYYGDYQMAAALHAELGDPVWVDEVIAIIRP